ncbi:MAG: type II toxin-antitoxin system HicA family toxin [Pirellulales bacterium]|nr:type II toxin-antitoxin system HicA family toxin [Pirellulales bacterium]
MPNKVPRVSGKDAVSAFLKVGYTVDRINGSHHILKHPQKIERLSIPVHAGKTVGVGLLSRQIKVAGMTVEQFTELL